MYVPRRPIVRAAGPRPGVPRAPAEAPPGGRPPPAEVVKALLCAPNHERGVPAEIAEISGETVRLRVPNEVNPVVPVGARVTVRLRHGSGEETLDGLLVQRIEQPVARLLVVRWVGDVTVLADPAVGRLFERRLAVRAVPSSSAPVPVVLTIPATDPPIVEAATAADLSVGGLGTLVSATFDRAAAAVTRLTCGLTLPGAGHHTLQVHVGHREWLAGGSVRYGLTFDAHDTARDRRALADICSWVLARGNGAAR